MSGTREVRPPRAPGTGRGQHRRPLPLFEGLRPLDPGRLPGEALAGLTLAALGIPEVLGYAKIAGMPVVSGLYTILLPIAVFAVLGSSRHLVVGADSATAAILAAGLAGLAAPGSARYVGLAGLSALLAGGLLLAARVVRLGFLANFLSRTVLVGFLTGVGVQVAAGQLPEMLGLHLEVRGTVPRLAGVARGIGHMSLTTLALALGTAVVVLASKRVARRIPGALIAVVAATILSAALGLSAHGVDVLGPVPPGLPHLGPPGEWGAIPSVVGTAASMFIVILAQSAATSRAYAARYDEAFDENTDLVGLGVANLAAGVSGTFVVNGSPTKTEIVDAAGGRSQLAQLCTAVVVLAVLLFLTGPLRYLPLAVLGAIVFLIGIDLVDVRGMRRILAVRRDEFVIALLTAAAVVFIGVEQGILLAIVLSVIDHLRYSYDPRNAVLVPSGDDRWRLTGAVPDQRTLDGLLIYRFGSSLYYANAHRLFDDVGSFVRDNLPLHWFCLDAAAIGDIDYSAAQTLQRVHGSLRRGQARLVLTDVSPHIRRQLDRYGITELVGTTAYFDTPSDVLTAYRAGLPPAPGNGPEAASAG